MKPNHLNLTVSNPLEFYGDRSGQLEDPFGHHWCVATKEDIAPEGMQERVQSMFGGKQ